MSFETFIKSTNLEDVNPLSPGGQPLFRSHEVLERELSKHLSSEHADFFAEPEISETTDRVDWYGPGEGFRTFISLEGEEQAEIRRRVASLFSDISALATKLEASDGSDERYLARLLAQALRVPSEESIFVGTNGPLITDWGTVARGAATEYHVLKILRDDVEANEEENLTTIDEGEFYTRGSGNEKGRPDQKSLTTQSYIPPALYYGSILGTVILVPIIMALLLRSCGIVVPGFLSGVIGGPLVSYCEITSQQDTLIDLIASYEREIQQGKNACVVGEDTVQAVPDEPLLPSIEGIVILQDVKPPIGQMCAVAVCANGLSTDVAQNACAKFDDIKKSLISDIPDGYCRAFIYPLQFSVDAGTKFTARYEVLANNELYQVFDVEAKTYSQQLLDILERNGHPRLYWVADFLWPPVEDAIDTKGSE